MDERKDIAEFLRQRYREDFAQQNALLKFLLSDDDIHTDSKLIHLKLLAQQNYADHSDYNTDWTIL